MGYTIINLRDEISKELKKIGGEIAVKYEKEHGLFYQDWRGGLAQMRKCDGGSSEACVKRVMAKSLKCEKDRIKGALKEWAKEKEREKKAMEKRARIKWEILKNTGSLDGVNTGKHFIGDVAEYGNENRIEVVAVNAGRYSSRCPYQKIEYRREVTIKRGYTLHRIGGILTFVRGQKVKREGMACEWFEQGRAFTDTRMVKGYVVKGEHIEARSLREAKEINARHRREAAATLLGQRAAMRVKENKMEKITVTFDDSIKAGNCLHGTNEFKRKVEAFTGKEVETLTGKEVMQYGKKFHVELYAKRAVAAAMEREKTGK